MWIFTFYPIYFVVVLIFKNHRKWNKMLEKYIYMGNAANVNSDCSEWQASGFFNVIFSISCAFLIVRINFISAKTSIYMFAFIKFSNFVYVHGLSDMVWKHWASWKESTKCSKCHKTTLRIQQTFINCLLYAWHTASANNSLPINHLQV